MVESVLFLIAPICQRYDLADRTQTLAGDAVHNGLAPHPGRSPTSSQS